MATNRKEEPQDFVERMLVDALAKGASDVYWLPCASHLNVRMRRDGLQSDVAEVPREFGERCVARIKVLARLLTYKTKVSQDGAIRDFPEKPGAELRVSVMPTSHGERVSIRVMQNERGPLYLEDLGFTPETVRALQDILDRPTGMIVLTGPTGSGKTTTIYALIRELLKRQQDPASIITMEDPIECEIDGISQTAVAHGADWGYAEALRAALRQDVKTLVVGEMRDKDVVKVTLDAALTGHRVITTYHAGDIPSVYARMLHQGFEPFLVASAITGVVSQRLIPRLDGKGRVPLMAVLAPNDEWRDFIAGNPGLGELRKKIRRLPSADLSAMATAMARDGLIAPEECKRLEEAGAQ
ncbi:MAG: hypothetical protein C0404_09745 [Verrucomicrobia bacterium]|nr:hypothetical protein [Verrucomicrobiota bacterium]